MKRFAWTLLAGCSTITPGPETITRVDTVEVIREVAPPLPAGDTVEICLSTGLTAQVLIGATGDTLIGDARVSLKSLRPVLAFAGRYLGMPADTVRFENRTYRRAGDVASKSCDELKHVGDYNGIPVFADVTAPQSLPAIVLPVRPGLFQTYMIPTPPARRR